MASYFRCCLWQQDADDKAACRPRIRAAPEIAAVVAPAPPLI